MNKRAYLYDDVVIYTWVKEGRKALDVGVGSVYFPRELIAARSYAGLF